LHDLHQGISHLQQTLIEFHTVADVACSGCEGITFMTWKPYLILCLILAVTGCIPVPVSTVALHPRQERPVSAESSLAENYGTFSSPAFDSSGALLATYDSGSKRVLILRSSDLALVNSLMPTRTPRRLSFSPNNRFLVMETYPGWIADYLNAKGSSTSHVDIDSPEAVKDNIQRVGIWDLTTGQTVTDLSCDAVVSSKPEGGWLWARRWAIVPGYRSSALLESHFSADEKEFSALCWNGVQQRWDSSNWQRLEDLPPPPFWDAVTGLTTAKWLAEEAPVTRSSNGRIALLRLRDKSFGFGTLFLWDRNTNTARKLPGECASRLQPVYALSRDGQRVVTVCTKDLGYSVRAWDLGLEKELPLSDAEFGFAGGIPTIRSGGVALSPDGRHLAVALIGQMEALLPNVLLIPAGISRSDLRLWSIDEGKELVTVPIDDLDGGSGFLGGVDLAFSPDSAHLAVGGRRLRIYRLSNLGASPH
jgi:hypothetical protein